MRIPGLVGIHVDVKFVVNVPRFLIRLDRKSLLLLVYSRTKNF